MLQLTWIMKRFIYNIWLFEAYVYYVYINRLEGIHICMCFICTKMKYLDQIRAMLTVPFIQHVQSKSAFASLTAFAFPSGTEKTVCSNIVIYGHNNQTISTANLNHRINHPLFLSNYDQNLVKVGLLSWKIVQCDTFKLYFLWQIYFS